LLECGLSQSITIACGDGPNRGMVVGGGGWALSFLFISLYFIPFRLFIIKFIHNNEPQIKWMHTKFTNQTKIDVFWHDATFHNSLEVIFTRI
jgi:hypothetical protein